MLGFPLVNPTYTHLGKKLMLGFPLVNPTYTYYSFVQRLTKSRKFCRVR